METVTTMRAGWAFWVIGIVSLAWNAFGCVDFTMTVTRNAGYLAQVPADMIDWLDSAPTWTIVPWAVGVWGALAGSLLLLLRSRRAVAAFALSLIGLAVNQIWQFTTNMPPSLLTPASIALTMTIWIVALALLWYAARMRDRGVLR